MFKKGVFGNGLPVVINWTKKSLAILVVFTLCFTWSSSVSDAAVESFDFEDDGSHFLQHQYDDNIENWHEWWYTNLHWTVGEDEYDMICAFRTLGNLSNPVYNSFGCGAYITKNGEVEETFTELFDSDHFSASDEICDVQMGEMNGEARANYIQMTNANTWVIHMENSTDPNIFSTDLTYTRVTAGASPDFVGGVPPDGWIRWTVPLPAATVSGSYTSNGITHQINDAHGYHDHNWGIYVRANERWDWGECLLSEQDMSIVFFKSTGLNTVGPVIISDSTSYTAMEYEDPNTVMDLTYLEWSTLSDGRRYPSKEHLYGKNLTTGDIVDVYLTLEKHASFVTIDEFIYRFTGKITIGGTTTTVDDIGFGEYKFKTGDTPDTTIPAPPTNIVVSGQETEDRIITWTIPTINLDGTQIDDITGYNIYRSTNPFTGYEIIGHVNSATTQYTDNGVGTGEYYYRITTLDEMPNESPRSTIKRDFGISCTNPFIDVGDDTGARTATYTIDVENFGQEEKTIDLSYEFITGSSDNWLVTGPDSKTVPAGSSLPTVFEIVANPITPPSEDSTCQIRVTATDGLYNTAQDLFTTMNSWETEIFCENTYEYIIPEQGANPGYYIEFTLNITNEGEVKDIIDLDWGPEEIRGDWDVHFYWSTGGELPYVGGDPTLQNTDSINPSRIGSHWRTVIARVSIPTGSVVNHNWKYHVEDITIEGISSGSVDAGRREDSTVLVRPLVSWLGVCVSDESSSYTNNLWSGTYPGHNVNPGMVTSYVIDVFNVGANNPISVSLDNPTSWTGTLNHDGQSGSIITIPQEDLPNIGGHVSVFLNVTAPIDALEGETAQMSVNIDDGVNIDNVIVTSHVTLKKKVVMIVYNGVNNESLGLNTEGGRLDIDGGLPLWPNLLELANTGSRYNNAIDIHLVGADPNYIGMITSSRSWTHGIWQVLGDYVGMNLETGLPICEGYTHDNVQVDTAFNSVKSSTPELRTAVVNAKYWIGEMMNDEDLDLAVSGLSHPHYIREPEAYLHGPPGSGRLPMDKKRAVLQPSDEWVFDAAINTMLYEDPDFLLIMNVESDNAGHRFGSECDPDAEEINPGADPENMRWIMHNLDEQTGRLFSQMKNRTGIDGISAYNETLITVSADHGMKTYHPPRGEYNFDPRKLMEENEIYQNTDYEFCMMQNTGFWIYNFTDNTTRDWTKQLFLSWTNETGTRVAWQVLNKTEMGEAISDMPPSQGQPFGLYNEATAEQMLSFPDLLVLMNPTFQTPIDYGTTYGFMDLIPNMPSHWPSFAEPGLVGGHLSYDTQAIPLILHGPYIKQEYTSDKTVEIIDIIPTICELNEWTGLTSGYFEDHEAEGTPLWDSFCSWTVDGTLGEWQPLDDPAISGSSSWKAQYYWASTSLVSWNITGLDTDDSLSLSTEIGGYLRPERSYTLRWLDWDIGILPREPDYVQYSDDVGIMVFVGNEAWNGSAVYTFEPFTFYFHGLEDAQIEWDMDDGTTLTSRTVDYAYQKSGFYYVTATAILPDGDVVYRQVVVYVTNRAPIPVMDIYQEALLEFSVAGTPGNTVVLEILEDGVVVQSAEQTRGKGTPLVDSIAIQVRPGREYALRLTHNGSGANPVEITLSAENTVECVENMVCFEVELNHQQHTALVIDLDQHLEATMESNRRVWFDASQSYDLDGEIMSYTWYLEDDTELAGMKIDQVFQETGEHSVWLYVFDDEDAYNSTYTAFNLSSLIRPPIIYPPLPPMPPGPGPYPVPIPPRPRPRPIVITIPADKLHIEYQWNNNGLWEIEETISYTTTLGDRNWSWTVPEDATNFQVRFRLVASSYFRIPGAAGSVYLNDIALEIT